MSESVRSLGLRRLVANADDFGQSSAITAGIIEAVEQGIVRSTSMMVRWSAHHEAAAWARRHAELSVGLHIDLGEWIVRDDAWQPLYEVVSLDDGASVQAEIERQVTIFETSMGRLPSHLDSHQHVHLAEPVRSIVIALGARLGVPVRSLSAARYCGDFYAQWRAGDSHPECVSYDALVNIFDGLGPGVTELACHPAADDADDVTSMYLVERGLERQTLCDARLPSELAARGIVLSSFLDAFAP